MKFLPLAWISRSAPPAPVSGVEALAVAMTFAAPATGTVAGSPSPIKPTASSAFNTNHSLRRERPGPLDGEPRHQSRLAVNSTEIKRGIFWGIY
jgi:hypothetical protein